MTTYASARHAAAVPSRVAAGDFPASSIRFDWAMSLLSVVLMGGVIQDGWAHAHGEVDQSFMTPWHAILYGSMALNGIVLGALALLNLRRGYPQARTLPFGYRLALVGVIFFAVAGLADLGWHTLFGIETGIDGLLSPSHLALATGAMLVFTGPLRSIARQYGPQTGGWLRVGPAAGALLAILTLMGFFAAYAQPIEDGFTTTSVQRGDAGALPVASLFAVDPNGAQLRRLFIPDGLDIYGITVAPDGRLAYRAQAARESQIGGLAPSDIYVTAADGTKARRITHSGRHDTQVAWSPDGARLAYVSMPAGSSGNFRINVVRADGSGFETLVDGVTTVQDPAWSPDGTHIAFTSRNGLDDMIASVDTATKARTWIPSTTGAIGPVWGADGLIYTGKDGALHRVAADGSQPSLLVKNASNAALAPGGATLAFVRPDRGSQQVFAAHADGSGARDVSQLPGLDATHLAIGADGTIYFSASGHGAVEHTQNGFDLATAAILIQAVMICGVLLLIVRRWRAPLGTFTVVLTLFALAMAAQTDFYVAGLSALAVGILADAYLALAGDRARSGLLFYCFAFGLAALFTVGFLIASSATGNGTVWPPNMLLGVPLVAGIAGLFVSFCYAPPLPEARTT